jgi:hypothetical protein
MSTTGARARDDGGGSSTRTCVGVTTFDDARESRRATPVRDARRESSETANLPSTRIDGESTDARD